MVAFKFGGRRYTIQFSSCPAGQERANLTELTRQATDLPVSEFSNGQLQASRSESVNFWDILSESQRVAFKATARERTFAAGAPLMQEGEQADHVAVILHGWTKICVHGDRQESVIAERGPGQLVGERAALRVGVRSATVIAQTMVRALVMTTEDFAAFVSVNPGVIHIVENQVYDRLTQAPSDYQIRRPQRLNGENCTVLLTDVVGFGGDARTDEDRLLIRKATSDMTQTILGNLWGECHSEDRGDGLLVIAPPHITTTAVIECLNRLPHELKRHNHTYADVLKVQIRAAVDVGPVKSDGTGLTGKAIINASRLSEAAYLKEAISNSNAALGVIVSNFVYDTVIRQGNDSIDSAGYRQIQLNVKETNTTAWMQLTGVIALVFRGEYNKSMLLKATDSIRIDSMTSWLQSQDGSIEPYVCTTALRKSARSCCMVHAFRGPAMVCGTAQRARLCLSS